MGNSLSQESKAVLEAAASGNADLVQQQIACDSKLLESVTLVKRRGVLHLAAKQGHPNIISAVLDPLLEEVKQEYHEYLESERQGDDTATQPQDTQQHQQQEQQQQSQGQQEQQTQEQLTQPQQPQEQLTQPQQPQEQLTQPQQPQAQGPALQPPRRPSSSSADIQLASFKKLRQTVNARDLYRRTPLIVAAKQGHLECAHLLVDAASNLFAMDREGNTSLHYAALHGHTAVVEYLLQRANDRGLGTRLVNKRNISGFSALHYATWSCHMAVVMSLLEGGADICAVNDRVFDAWVPVPIGSTPLHLAAMRGSVPVALLLLQHYVLSLSNQPRERPRPTDPRTIPNLYGMNPAQLAAHRNNRQMAQLLMPSVSLSRLLSTQTLPIRTPRVETVTGPPSLKAIAGAVLQQTLTRMLDSMETAHAAETLKAQAAASACSCSTRASSKQPHGPCSGVCVESCERVQLEDGRGADVAQPPRSGSSSSRIVVVQAGGSMHTTPASSRAASPDEAGRASPTGCASASQVRPKSVSFSATIPDECHLDADTGMDRAFSSSSQLCSSLTTASSSGWYDELCCVCWENEVTAVIEPCKHAMCLGCARQLVGCNVTTGPTCPLCRACIAGFTAVPHCARQQAGKHKKCLLAGANI